MRRALAVALFVLAVAPPAVAQAKTETATAGTVTARLSFEEGGDEPGFKNVRVQVERAGSLLVDEPIEKDCDFCLVVPAGGGSDDAPSIHVRDLEGDAEPEVVVDLFTGGANCCFYSLVWRLDGTAYKRFRLRPGGSFGYDPRNLDRKGSLELVSQDYRFAYKYGSNVDTPRPVRIFRFRAGKLVDVTRSFKSFPKREAASLWRFYLKLRKDQVNLRGILAAYVADEYKAGRGRIAWKRLRMAEARGDLRDKIGGSTGPFGRKFVVDLRKFLRRTGYIR
jgi:hypothetical protein